MGPRLAVVAAALVSAAALSPSSALAAEPFTKTTLSFDVKTGPDGGTPCTIVADFYVPQGASKAAPVPAILATNGFGGSKNEFSRLGPAYARRGYAFLAYSGLGFGGSSCKITLDDPDWDGKAGSQLVSFLGGTKAATDGTKTDVVQLDGPGDPRVGMTGGSYGGQIQFAVAGVDPRVDALNPQITWNELEYSLAGNTTDLPSGVSSATPGVAKLDWPTLFSAVGVEQGLQQAVSAGDTSHVGVCPNFADQVCPGLLASAALGYADAATAAFLHHASVAAYMKKIKVPVFLAQGENDTLFNLNEAVATYKALLDQGTPVKLLFRSAGHSGGTLPNSAESNSTDLEKAYESRMSLEWFDWYLRGIGDAPKLDFSFYRDWVKYDKDAAPAVGRTPSYPAATSREVALDGSLSLLSIPAGTSSDGAAFAGVPALPPAPGTEGSLDAPTLGDDLEVAGIPSVTMKVDAPAQAAAQSATEGKLVLFARLEDVDGNGAVTTPGNIVASARVADVTKPVTIQLPGIVHRFEKGHNVRLTVGTAHLLRRGNVVPGPVTISDAKLTLPVLGAVAGAAGAGPSGTTNYTASPQALRLQKDGAGGPPAGTPAAVLPSAKRCASRRRFVITLRAPRRDRVRTASVLVNGKRAKTTRRGATVDLRGLPKGTFRVLIAVRTRKGKVLRSARTYRTCTPKARKAA